MNDFAIFGISIIFGFIGWGLFSYNYLWPHLKRHTTEDAVRPLLYFHFFRYVGASFLVDGVTGHLPREFAAPGAYGDLMAVVLALIALASLRSKVSTGALWIFNVWGAGDLLFAFYQGLSNPHFRPSALGATFYIPTVYVPLLLCTHFMIFALLLRRSAPQSITS